MGQNEWLADRQFRSPLNGTLIRSVIYKPFVWLLFVRMEIDFDEQTTDSSKP